MNDYRTEHDLLGDLAVPAGAMHGVDTARALENFSLSGRPPHPELVAAYGVVKLACARTNRALGAWKEDATADAIERACSEMAEGQLTQLVVVDALQGGAGASTNMNVNEVLANRALQILDKPFGSYDVISPLDNINLSQSTNDTYPTALKLAAVRLLRRLEENVVALAVSRLSDIKGRTTKELAVADGMLTAEQFDELVSPEAVMRLGNPTTDHGTNT